MTFVLLTMLASAFLSTGLALRKRRNPVAWFFCGLLLTWPAVVVLILLLPNTREHRGPIPTAADDLALMTSRGEISPRDADLLRARIDNLPSRASVLEMVEPMQSHVRNYAKKVALTLAVLFHLCMVGPIVLGLSGDELVGYLVAFELTAGLLPALAAYWLITRDIGAVHHVVGCGTAYPARIEPGLWPTALGVIWLQEGEKHHAHLTVRKTSRIDRDVTVFVARGYPMVAVLLNNDQLHAARVVRQYHVFKRRRRMA